MLFDFYEQNIYTLYNTISHYSSSATLETSAFLALCSIVLERTQQSRHHLMVLTTQHNMVV